MASEIARQCLREAWKRTKQGYPFKLDALCLLPDHLHCIWILPENDSNYPLRWAMINGLFSKSYLKHVDEIEICSNSRMRKGEASLWQRRYLEHTIRDEEDYGRYMDYIHYNPVKHGLVNAPWDWKWSTFDRFVALGYYARDWGMNEPSSIKETHKQIEYLE